MSSQRDKLILGKMKQYLRRQMVVLGLLGGRFAVTRMSWAIPDWAGGTCGDETAGSVVTVHYIILRTIRSHVARQSYHDPIN